MKSANFDLIARPYRWLEYLSFGPLLERCRFRCVDQLADRRHALILGDGDGRFTARLLATHREIEVVAVDSSSEMLTLLTRRVARLDGAAARLQTWRGDALCFNPEVFPSKASYDLIATHFFLDCLSVEEISALIGKVRPALTPGAIWLVSEFAIPASQPVGFAARLLIALLYFAFRMAAGVKVHRLPDYRAAMRDAGFARYDRKSYLGGILVSEVWIQTLEKRTTTTEATDIGIAASQ